MGYAENPVQGKREYNNYCSGLCDKNSWSQAKQGQSSETPSPKTNKITRKRRIGATAQRAAVTVLTPRLPPR